MLAPEDIERLKEIFVTRMECQTTNHELEEKIANDGQDHVSGGHRRYRRRGHGADPEMMDCSKCDKGGVYNTTVPFVVHENLRAQMSAVNARLIRVIVLLIFLLVGSNIAWLVYESQFADEYYEITQENEDGYNNFIGNDGDIYNGEANDQGKKENP